MEGDNINMAEVKKCLEDAGMWDETMSRDTRIECYKAIKNSETTHQMEESMKEANKSMKESADELMEAIQISEAVSPSSKKRRCVEALLDENGLCELTVVPTNNNHIQVEEEDKGEVILDGFKARIGFNDMPKSGPCPLQVMEHKPKYMNFHNSEKYQNADNATRTAMFMEYHAAMAKLRYDFSRMYGSAAPKCRPIIATTDPLVNPTISHLKDEESASDSTYVSRSGRLTKRKVYNEWEDLDSEQIPSISTKRSKPEENFSVKARPSKARKCELSTSTGHNNDNNNNDSDSLQDFAESVSTFSVKSCEEDEFDRMVNSSLRKTNSSKKSNVNEEIMARSSLFKDNVPKRGRAGALFKGAKEQLEKQKRQDEEMDRLTRSLDAESDDEPVSVTVADSPEKRRVVAPIPRRPINRKRAEPLVIKTKRISAADETDGGHAAALVNGQRAHVQPVRRNGAGNNNNHTATASAAARTKKNVNTVVCPLCAMTFPQKEIQEHASTCGEDMFPQTAQQKRITCEICETVVPFTTDYEVHVKGCIAKQNRH